LSALINANPQISNPNLIYAGQRVNIPGGGSGNPPPGNGNPNPEQPPPPSGDTPTYAPYTVYSTGERPAFAVNDPDQLQPHHDYQTKVRDGQTLEVRDVVLHRNGQSQTQQAIPAPIAGEVIHAGPMGTAGNAVVIRGDNGQLTYIFHMSSIDVRAGQRVGYGQDLGNQGSTGHSTGPHVHIEAPPAVIDRWVNDLIDGSFDGRRGGN
jgi:murein DD-endopeptidase MepM/ murein hydrolase activator NlpD